jgi:hypothetical protein
MKELEQSPMCQFHLVQQGDKDISLQDGGEVMR